jgi:hypothetical protein
MIVGCKSTFAIIDLSELFEFYSAPAAFSVRTVGVTVTELIYMVTLWAKESQRADFCNDTSFITIMPWDKDFTVLNGKPGSIA